MSTGKLERGMRTTVSVLVGPVTVAVAVGLCLAEPAVSF